MSREIKFRVWDKVNKCFLHDFFIDGDGSIYEESPAFDDYYTEMTMLNSSELSVMQFTGLKDKNGVKIYEGDIVKIKLGDEHYNFVVSEVDGNTVLLDPRNHNAVYDFLAVYKGEFEVIGNIHENKDLLS